MAIKPVGYAGKAALLPKLEAGAGFLPKTAVPKAGTAPYNPFAYAPGQGTIDSPVPAAIQKAGFAKPGPNPVYVPSPVPGRNTTATDDGTDDGSGGGGGGGGGGSGSPFSFNWGAYLAAMNDDPVMKAALGADTTNRNSWRRQLESAIRGGVVGGGWDISGKLKDDPLLQNLNTYISPEMWGEINAAAAGNQLSTKAQLAKRETQNIRANAYKQAAMGTLGSGAHSIANTNTADETVLAANSAQQQLMDALRGAQGTYLSNVAGADQQLVQTRGEVAARLAAQEGAAYDAQAAAALAAEQGQTPADTADEGTTVPGKKPAAGISWGGVSGITSIAQLMKHLAPGVTYAAWKANHPKAAAQLEGIA